MISTVRVRITYMYMYNEREFGHRSNQYAGLNGKAGKKTTLVNLQLERTLNTELVRFQLIVVFPKPISDNMFIQFS